MAARRRPAAILFSILPLLAAGPAARGAQTVTPCSIGAYVIDRDPNGLNVRAEPAAGARVLTRLHEWDEVEVTGARGAWLRIRNATNDEGPVWTGPGWVYAPMLGTSTTEHGPVPLRREPRGTSPVVRRLRDGTQVTLLGCRGDWAHVRVGNLTGWLDRDSQCSLTRTTCA